MEVLCGTSTSGQKNWQTSNREGENWSVIGSGTDEKAVFLEVSKTVLPPRFPSLTK